MPPYVTRAGESYQRDKLFVAGLETRRGTGWDIQAHAVGCRSIELQRWIDFVKMVVAANLHRAVAGVPDNQLARLRGRG